MLFKNYNELISNGMNCEIKRQRKDILDILNLAFSEVDPYKTVKGIIKEGKIKFDK